jgi:hypothetical protein
MHAVVTVKLGLVSHLNSTCHLTHKLGSRFHGSGLVVGVPPNVQVQIRVQS